MEISPQHQILTKIITDLYVLYSVYREIDESIAVSSRVPQARVTLRLQTSDVSMYTLYNTFMFPDPAAIYRNVSTSISRHCLAQLGNSIAPHNQRIYRK